MYNIYNLTELNLSRKNYRKLRITIYLISILSKIISISSLLLFCTIGSILFFYSAIEVNDKVKIFFYIIGFLLLFFQLYFCLKAIFVVLGLVYLTMLYLRMRYSAVKFKIIQHDLTRPKLKMLLDEHSQISKKLLEINCFIKKGFSVLFVLFPTTSVLLYIGLFTDGFGFQEIRFMLLVFAILILFSGFLVACSLILMNNEVCALIFNLKFILIFLIA